MRRSLLFVTLLLLAALSTLICVLARSTRDASVTHFQSMDYFRFDPEKGTINDVPASRRRLDGQKVAIDGVVRSRNTSMQMSDFPFEYNVSPTLERLPLVQELIFAHLAHGKTMPRAGQYSEYMRLTGTLHVNVRREGEMVGSVFQMDVDRAEILRDSDVGFSLGRYLRDDRFVVCDVLAAFMWFAASACSVILGVRRSLRYVQSQRLRKRGLCPGCGYDLRAGTGRCPECGSTERFEPLPILHRDRPRPALGMD